MVLRTLLILKGHKRNGRSVSKMYRAEGGRRERVIGNSIELFDVFYEPSKILYLFRDFVTVFS